MSKESNAAKAFAAKWKGQGAEKQQSQLFWLELMEKVLGAPHPMDLVRFEEKVKLSHTSFIDIMVPSTHTMIEQKGITKELSEPIKQSDGTMLTPFQQAKRYAIELPYSVELGAMLRKDGVPVPRDIVTEDDLVKSLAALVPASEADPLDDGTCAEGGAALAD